MAPVSVAFLVCANVLKNEDAWLPVVEGLSLALVFTAWLVSSINEVVLRRYYEVDVFSLDGQVTVSKLRQVG